MQDIYDETAEKLVNKCPANVFDIEDTPAGIVILILAVKM